MYACMHVHIFRVRDSMTICERKKIVFTRFYATNQACHFSFRTNYCKSWAESTIKQQKCLHMRADIWPPFFPSFFLSLFLSLSLSLSRSLSLSPSVDCSFPWTKDIGKLVTSYCTVLEILRVQGGPCKRFDRI